VREDEDAVHHFLDAQPERDVYLRSLFWGHGTRIPQSAGTLHGWFEDGIRGVFLHGPSIVIACSDPEGLTAFATLVSERMGDYALGEVLSPKGMVEPFMTALRARIRMPRIRLFRPEMPAMFVDWDSLRRPTESGVRGGSAPVRQATPDELPALLPICRATAKEELGIDPAEDDEAAFRSLVERRVRTGREWLWWEEGQIVFRAAVSAATPEAVLVEGVYTPPAERGRGRGTLGMHVVAERLLRWHARVVLFVDGENSRALRLYERLGFRQFHVYQAIYFDSDGQTGPPARPWARGSTPGLRIAP
jgi:GNAT superfamily N-acetyltransferase